MRLVIVSDAFPPLRSSGAVQLRDLSREFVRQGHHVSVIVASADLKVPWAIEAVDGVRIVRLRTMRNKDVGLFKRTVAESLMPWLMLRAFRKCPLSGEKWDGVIWYSPTIFLGPVAGALRRSSGCRSYLIVRDIFPEWMVDMGLMGRGVPYWFFRLVARYQYSVADVIGVQTPGNSTYFARWSVKAGRRLEVLHNWLAPGHPAYCSISVSNTSIARRKVFVYAGNMGIAQGMQVLVELATRMRSRSDVGFLFVGRGSAVASIKEQVRLRGLENVVLCDEIDPDEIPGLYAQCHAGLVALDTRHRTHNIPGKFLSYMHAGIPVLAAVNPGNDIVSLIEDAQVGRVCTDGSVEDLHVQAERLLVDIQEGVDFRSRCQELGERLFSVSAAATQVVRALVARVPS